MHFKSELPADEQAERYILGTLLHGRSIIDELACQIDPTLFVHPSSGIILAAIVDLYARGTPVSIITLTQHLQATGKLDSVGGAAEVTKLSETFCPGIESARHQLSVLHGLWVKREVIQLGHKLANTCSATDIGPLIRDAESRIEKLRQASLELREKRIRFFRPSELRGYEPDTHAMLVGNCHVMRGEVFVIGGEPGIGKSMAATELAFCGATVRPWFALEVHCRFKTMVVQAENGRYRLMQEYQARGEVPEIESRILVSEPPPYGLTLSNPEFLADVKDALAQFQPDVVILDPWNAAVKDDKQRDYSEAFHALRMLLPKGEARPALGIVAHTRKPKTDEKRTGGTALMHLLAGSHMLASVPRSVFIMTPASTDETDEAVVWFNPKNNNGEKVGRSAWRRTPAGFTVLPDFDWEQFDEQGGTKRRIVTEQHIREALSGSGLNKASAVRRLQEVTKLGKRACEKALSVDGKFRSILTMSNGAVTLANE
jgi:hypothetical protein